MPDNNILINIGVIASGIKEIVSSAISEIGVMERVGSKTLDRMKQRAGVLKESSMYVVDPKIKSALAAERKELEAQIALLEQKPKLQRMYKDILREIKGLHTKGIISNEEYADLKRATQLYKKGMSFDVSDQFKQTKWMKYGVDNLATLSTLLSRFNNELNVTAGLSEKLKTMGVMPKVVAQPTAATRQPELSALDAERKKILETKALQDSVTASAKEEVKIAERKLSLAQFIRKEQLKFVGLAAKAIAQSQDGFLIDNARKAIVKGIKALDQERLYVLRQIAVKSREIASLDKKSVVDKQRSVGLSKDIDGLQGRYRKLTDVMRNYALYTGQKIAAEKKSGGTIQALAQKHRQFSDMLGIAIGKIIRYRMAFVGMQRTVQALRDSEKIFRTFQYGLSEIRRVMLPMTGTMPLLERSATRFATQFGVELMDTLGVMKIWAQQGKSSADIQKLTRTTLIGMVAAGLEANQTVEALTSANKQYNISADESLSIIDKLLFVQARHAVTTQDLADAIKVLGTTASNVGISLDSLLGDVTAVSSVTRKTGKETANSLKTIFARFVRPDVVKQLNLVGISTMKSKDEMRGLTDVLGDIKAKWASLTQIQKLNISLMVGGVRRYNDFLVLMDNYDEALVAAEESATATGYAQYALSIDMDTLQRQMAIASQKTKVFGVELGRVATQPFAKLIIGMSEFLEKSGEVNTGLAKNLGWVLKWGTALGAIATSSWLVTLAFGTMSKGLTGIALAFAARSFTTFPIILFRIAKALGAVAGITSYKAATDAMASMSSDKLAASQWTVSMTADGATASMGRLGKAQAFVASTSKALWASNLAMSAIMAAIGFLVYGSIKGRYEHAKADMQMRKGISETTATMYKAADAEENLLNRREQLLSEMEYFQEAMHKAVATTDGVQTKYNRLQIMLTQTSKQYGKVIKNNAFLIDNLNVASEESLRVERELVEEKKKHVALLMQQSKMAALAEIKNYEARLDAANKYMNGIDRLSLGEAPFLTLTGKGGGDDVGLGAKQTLVVTKSFDKWIEEVQAGINKSLEEKGLTTKIEINPKTDLYKLREEYNDILNKLRSDTAEDYSTLNEELARVSKETLDRIKADLRNLTSEEKSQLSEGLDAMYDMVGNKGAKLGDSIFVGLTPENLNTLIEKYNELGGSIVVGFDVFIGSANKLAKAYHDAGEEFNALDATVDEYNKSYKEAIELQGRYLGKQKARENAILQSFRKEKGYIDDITTVKEKEEKYFGDLDKLRDKRDALEEIQRQWKNVSDAVGAQHPLAQVLGDEEITLKIDIKTLEDEVESASRVLSTLYTIPKFASALEIGDEVARLTQMRDALKAAQADTGAIDALSEEKDLQIAVNRTLADLEARLPIVKKLQAQRILEKKELADIERQYEMNTADIENQYEKVAFYGASINADYNKRIQLLDFEYEKNKSTRKMLLDQKTIGEDIYKNDLQILDADLAKAKAIETMNYFTKKELNSLTKERELNELIVDFLDKRIESEGKLAVVNARTTKEKIAIQKSFIDQQMVLAQRYSEFEISKINESSVTQAEKDEQILANRLEVFKKLAGLRSQKIELDYSGLEQFRQDVTDFVKTFSSNIASALVGLSSKQVELSSELRDVDKQVLDQRKTILEAQQEITQAEEDLKAARQDNSSKEEIESQEAELRNLNKELDYENKIMSELERKQDRMKTGWATIKSVVKEVLGSVSDMITEMNKAQLSKALQEVIGTGEGSLGEQLAATMGDVNRDMYTNLEGFRGDFKTDLNIFLESEKTIYTNFLSGLSYTLSSNFSDNDMINAITNQSKLIGSPAMGTSIPSERPINIPSLAGTMTGDAVGFAKDVSKSQAWKKVGTIMATEFGRVLGTSLGGGTQGAAIGSSMGSLLGMIPGYGAILGPAGALLGGLFGGMLDKPEKQYIEPILENTDAVKDNTDATYSVTNALIDLRSQLINAPASFSLPPTARIPSLQGGGSVSQSGLAMVHKGETVGAGNVFNINIEGNASRDTVDYMIDEFKRITTGDRRFSNQRKLSSGTRSRYL